MSLRIPEAREERMLDLYWKEIRDNQPLERDEEVELFRRLRAGDHSALQPIVEANLRFVVRVANEFARAGGPSVAELVAEGNLGLLRAIDRFDETRGFKFITYAVWWIRQAMRRTVVRHSRSTLPPMNRLEDSRQLYRKTNALEQSLGREATFDEIVDASDLGPERVRNALEATHTDVSLDEPLSEDGDGTLKALLASPESEAEVDGDSPERTVAACLSLLDDRECVILRAYYGLDEEAKTLEEIGAEIGITRERVRQLRNRALERLRAQLMEVDQADGAVEWSLN